MSIREELFALRDIDFAAFQAKLIPTVKPERIIGVRTPALRKLASEIRKKGRYKSFLHRLPHYYFDENQLHSFIISAEDDFDIAMSETERFLPYVDNWATCDQMSPKVFAKHKTELRSAISRWIKSDKPYTVRFAIIMLLQHFLEEDFSADDLEAVALVKSDEYYVNMMRAWYFATALAKQRHFAIKYIEDDSLDIWTHNMTIRKACESFRVPDRLKEYLKNLKR